MVGNRAGVAYYIRAISGTVIVVPKTCELYTHTNQASSRFGGRQRKPVAKIIAVAVPSAAAAATHTTTTTTTLVAGPASRDGVIYCIRRTEMPREHSAVDQFLVSQASGDGSGSERCKGANSCSASRSSMCNNHAHTHEAQASN